MNQLGMRNEELEIGGGARLAAEQDRKFVGNGLDRSGALFCFPLHWKFFICFGTVKTVPYRASYCVLLPNKRSVGRDALIPPWRNLAGCSRRGK